MTFKYITEEPYNPFFKQVGSQKTIVLDQFELETGDILKNVELAYKTWGKLNDERNNVMVICHAFTGSADVADWWGPLLGVGRAFDPSRYFIICFNALGSPYGSASPCTLNSETGQIYGPEFPLATVKDDARIQKVVLDILGINQVAVVIGGSMGGMLALEYAYFGKNYVRALVAIATCAEHSAWGISWGEAQRQSIFSDPKYRDGYYPFDDPPVVGLGAARMAAMLTYRSRNSFETKFSRRVPDPRKHKIVDNIYREPATEGEERWVINNHGHSKNKKMASPLQTPSVSDSDKSLSRVASNTSLRSSSKAAPQTYFSAQSYLRYQGEKFVKRFDANCYVALTRKLDTHDVSRGRTDTVEEALALIECPTQVIGIKSDGLFTFTEQERINEFVPDSELHNIDSPDGHDGFLLEFAQINKLIVQFLCAKLPEFMENWKDSGVGELGNSSVFGEAEVEDVTSW